MYPGLIAASWVRWRLRCAWTASPEARHSHSKLYVNPSATRQQKDFFSATLSLSPEEIYPLLTFV